jgi:hypothetical protein
MTVHPEAVERTQQEGTGSGVMVINFTFAQGGIYPIQNWQTQVGLKSLRGSPVVQ